MAQRRYQRLTISWEFSADWDLVPDLHELVLAVDHASHRQVPDGSPSRKRIS
jgi:hypothetical protein